MLCTLFAETNPLCLIDPACGQWPARNATITCIQAEDKETKPNSEERVHTKIGPPALCGNPDTASLLADELCTPEQRLERYTKSFATKLDQVQLDELLAEEVLFLNAARRTISDDTHRMSQLVTVWQKSCQGNLGDTKSSRRSSSFLTGLLIFHDPTLWKHLHSNQFNFNMKELYSFYVGDESYPPIIELWDASIIHQAPGFLTPTQGSFFFGLGLMLNAREELLTNEQDLHTIMQQVRLNSGKCAKRIISVGSQAAKCTPNYFLQLLSEPELDLASLQEMSMTEANPIALDLSSSVHESNKEQANKSLWKQLVGTEPKPKLGYTALATRMKSALGFSADSDFSAPHQRFFVVEYAGEGKIGLQLSQSAIGLHVHGFDKRQGEAEVEGSVKKGDFVHSVNGVPIRHLSPRLAGQVIAHQLRPLCFMFSSKMTPEEEAMYNHQNEQPRSKKQQYQEKLLKARLVHFYMRFEGIRRVGEIDSILRIYYNHEPTLYRSLFAKYGEPAPGDDLFNSDYVLISGREAIELGLTQESSFSNLDSDFFIDVRTQSDRECTGLFRSCMLFGQQQEEEKLIDSILASQRESLRKGLRVKRVCLLLSGTEKLFSMVEPKQAAQAEEADQQVVDTVVAKLAARGVFFTCITTFVECLREAMYSKPTQWGEGLLVGAPKKTEDFSLLLRQCIGYSAIDFKDPLSISQYISQHFQMSDGTNQVQTGHSMIGKALLVGLLPPTSELAASVAQSDLPSVSELLHNLRRGGAAGASPVGGRYEGINENFVIDDDEFSGDFGIESE